MENNTDKKSRILQAAGQVFAQNGFSQSTIAMIAKNAGVADGTIYLYFKNKEELLTRFFENKMRLIFDRFLETVSGANSAEEKLRNLIRMHFVEFQKDKDMAVLYQVETHSNVRLAEDQIREMSKMYMDLISLIVEQGQEQGLIRKDLYLSLVKRMIIGSLDEVINTWIHSEGKYDLVSMADPLVDLILNGIGNHLRPDA
ncbi:MAG: TetR family transcriptional regulator [Proteobacteria bacterium]|nr:TetR family transcriptional regulator [Pseudomonadota bacterium]MBU4468896.1 TetR family transcriptional regulator [Pseudomonadota bacterium]MCG2750889.1 TetR family transcriptional regulator [Desulfobacteraceae bacterium]